MGEPAKIAQKIDPHLRDLAVVDAVLAPAPRPEVDREIFPRQFLLVKRERETDVLKFEVRRHSAQRFPQCARAHQPVGNIRVSQIRPGH